MEEKQKLLNSITRLFMRNGIKSMTMDDFSRGLGMSKKTLYKHFKDKNQMVCECIHQFLEEEKASSEILFAANLNAIDELLEIIKTTGEKIQEFHPSLHYDLEKYHPEAWQLFIDYKFTHLFNCVVMNMEKGIKEGLYRDDLNIKIIARMHVARVDMVFDPQLFPATEFQFIEVLKEMVRYHLAGISSEKGYKYIKEKFNH